MSRRTPNPSLERKLHDATEAFAAVAVQTRCLHAPRGHLGDLDFLAAALKTLETAAHKARVEAEYAAGRERKEADM